MIPSRRLIAPVVALLALASACGGGDSASDVTTASGSIFIDSTGSRVCESMMESYPPQCGEQSVELVDLNPEAVVALMSPEDPSLAPVSWTDYTAGVEGDPGGDGLSNVDLTDPVYVNSSEGLALRTADLGIVIGEATVWPFDVTNGTDAEMALTFTSGQRIELTLHDDSGEVYRWSDGMMFTQAIEEAALLAGAKFPYVLRGEPIDLPPGDYTAEAWVTALEASSLVLEWQVTISE